MKETRGYDVRRVIGLPDDDDRVDVKIGDIGDVASEETLESILQKLVDVITENDEIRAKIVGDVTIESVEVDNVQLIDSDGNKLVFTEDGEINFIAADGKIATLGATTDEATAETVIGLLKSLKAKDYATEAKLEAVRDLLETISELDFSTETTLQSVEALLDAISKLDFSTETTLDSLKTFLEVLGTTADADSLNTMIGLLKNLKGKDFATQTTLATLATEAKLETVRELLEDISGLDFAEETTLDGLKTVLEGIKDSAGIKKIVDRVDVKLADGDNVALGATSDASTVTTVIGLLKKLQSILETGIGVTESSPLTSIGTTVGDGDDEALGSTSDTDSDTTVIGRLQKLISDLSVLSASKTLSDLEAAIEGVTDSIESMQYGGLPISEMRTDVVSSSSTPAEAKGGATAWSGQRIIHILNQGSVNIEVLTDDEATYGQIVFPGDVYQDVVDGVIYVMSASAGSARVTEKRYVSS